MKQEKTVIGLVGRIGAGKDEAAKYLSQRLGWPIFQISAPLKEETVKRGIELTRENIQKVGVEFAQKYGDGYLAELAIKSFEGNGIISGPRQLGQIKYFKNNCRFILIFVGANDEVRFNRVQNRNSVKEAHTLEKFIKDEQEKDVLGPVQRLEDCIKLSDYSITNNTSLENLARQLEKIIDTEELS